VQSDIRDMLDPIRLSKRFRANQGAAPQSEPSVPPSGGQAAYTDENGNIHEEVIAKGRESALRTTQAHVVQGYTPSVPDVYVEQISEETPSQTVTKAKAAASKAKASTKKVAEATALDMPDMPEAFGDPAPAPEADGFDFDGPQTGASAQPVKHQEVLAKINSIIEQ
jgi:hypothetical protein